MNRNIQLALLASLALGMSGCANMNNTQAGAVAGTGLGAVTGAIVGEATGHPGAGALIGGATGAVVGSLVGNAEDMKEERDAAVAHAQYEAARNRAMAYAITEAQVVEMTHNRVSDSVIINSIRKNGCLWDGSPEAVIRLKQSGVSDRVIATMQNTGAPQPVAASSGPPAYYYAPPPPPVGVVVVGPRYYRPYGRPYYRRW